MVCTINLIGFMILCIFLCFQYKEKIVSAIPVCLGIWIVILLGLAYIRQLNAIDYICIGIIFLGVFYFIKRKEEFREFIVKENILGQVLIVGSIYFLVYLIMRIRLASHWDELGVWALEVKSLYFLNGFAEKGKHVAIEFGDYFPAQMLFEWWTCHLNPKKYDEGLMYTGYYWLYLSFILPVLKNIKLKLKHYVFIPFISTFIIVCLPSVSEVFSYSFLSVELIMSVVYALLLFVLFCEQRAEKSYIKLELSVFSMLLMFLKETGIIYALMAWAFGIGLKYVHAKADEISKVRNIDLFKTIEFTSFFIISSLPMLSWRVFCIIAERRKYFDGIAFKAIKDIVKGRYEMWEYTIPQIKSFFEAIIWQPLHRDKSWGIDLTIFMCIVLIITLIFFIKKYGIFDTGKECIFVVIHYGICFVIYSICLLCMHIFIFQEKRYIDPIVMINSFARYEEPLFLGMLIFLFMVILENSKHIGVKVRISNGLYYSLAIIIACANFQLVYDGIINYSASLDNIYKNRKEIRDEQINFLQEIDKIQEKSARILFVGESDRIHGTRSLQFEVCPYSIAFLGLMENASEEDNVDVILQNVRKYHCEYIYFDGIGKESLSDMVKMNHKIMKIKIDGEDQLVLEDI